MRAHTFRLVLRSLEVILLLGGLLAPAIGSNGCGSVDGHDEGLFDEAQISRIAKDFPTAAMSQDWEEVYTLSSADAVAQAESLP